MAYLGSTSRNRATAGAVRSGPMIAERGRERPAADVPRYPALPRHWELPTPPESAITFGAGLAVGLTLGAALAMVLTPRTGAETRAALRRSARRMGSRSRDAWDELRDELQFAARRGKRRVGRAIERGGWAAEELMDRRRRRRRSRARVDD